jgi:hypothetical protein
MIALKKNSWLCLFFLCFNVICFAQRRNPPLLVVDTILGGFPGKLQYTLISNAEFDQIMQGPVGFNSDLRFLTISDDPVYDQLSFKGRFNKDQKDGEWVVSLNRFFLTKPTLQQSAIYRLNHQLDGIAFVHYQNYAAGKRNGIWKLYSKPFLSGRPGKESDIGRIELTNDTVRGSFYLKLEESELAGICNAGGFLDGELSLQYTDDGFLIKETRVYRDGFLMNLEKKNALVDTIMVSCVYDDVIRAKESMSLNEGDVRRIKDDRRYGLLFDHNYEEGDERIVIQKAGNSFLQAGIDKLFFGDFLLKERETSFTGFHTARFRFNYHPNEQIFLDSCLSLATSLLTKIDSVLERPKFILRKSGSQNLTAIQFRLLHIKEKLVVIKNEVRLLQSDYFDFKDRELYYKEGILGLNSPDTIRYNFQGKEWKELFFTPFYIDAPQRVIQQLVAYGQYLEKEADGLIFSIQESLLSFEQQDVIDELEQRLAIAATKLEATYPSGLKNDPIPFADKMYQSVYERLIEPVQVKYLNNALSLEEAVVAGNKMICLMNFLSDNRLIFDRIERLPKIWNDSVFTIYQDNPFDYRLFESKVLGGVQSAANILLKHQANQMLNSKNCDSLLEDLGSIIKLEKRVMYLQQNYLNENVKLLDRSLRRERVPVRIIRMLEL